MYKILSIETKLEAIYFLGAFKTFGSTLPTVEEFLQKTGLSRGTLYNLLNFSKEALEDLFLKRTPGPGKASSALSVVRQTPDPRLIGIAAEIIRSKEITPVLKEKVVLLADSLKRDQKLSYSAFSETTGLNERTLRIWRKSYDGTLKSLEDRRIKTGKSEKKRTSFSAGFKKLFEGAQVLIDTTAVKIFGFSFCSVACMDAFSKKILSIRVFWKENSDRIIKTMQAAMKRSSIISFVMDNGRPYIAEKTRNFLSNSEIATIKCAPYHPESKGALERFFRTIKTWIKNPLKLFSGLLLDSLIRIAAVKYNSRLKNNISAPINIEESFIELEKRSLKSTRKRDIIDAIRSLTFINNKKPHFKELKAYPIDVLEEAFKRFKSIINQKGKESSVNTGAYFLGIAKNIMPEYEKKQKRYRKLREKEILEKTKKELEELEAQRKDAFRKAHPELSLLDLLEAAIHGIRFKYISPTVARLIIRTWMQILEKYGVSYTGILTVLQNKISVNNDFNMQQKSIMKDILNDLIFYSEIKNKKIFELIKNPQVEFKFDDAAFEQKLFKRGTDRDPS